jgi:hypothetical protein
LYLDALRLYKKGTHVVSTDEMTGIQALERLYPTLPLRPGLIERQEFEYRRHGTQCLIASLEVALGLVIAPYVGCTRSEVDFVNHISNVIDTEPTGTWIFITDQLNIHKSESLVRLVQQRCGLQDELVAVRAFRTPGDSHPFNTGSSRATSAVRFGCGTFG